MHARHTLRMDAFFWHYWWVYLHGTLLMGLIAWYLVYASVNLFPLIIGFAPRYVHCGASHDDMWHAEILNPKPCHPLLVIPGLDHKRTTSRTVGFKIPKSAGGRASALVKTHAQVHSSSRSWVQSGWVAARHLSCVCEMSLERVISCNQSRSQQLFFDLDPLALGLFIDCIEVFGWFLVVTAKTLIWCVSWSNPGYKLAQNAYNLQYWCRLRVIRQKWFIQKGNREPGSVFMCS